MPTIYWFVRFTLYLIKIEMPISPGSCSIIGDDRAAPWRNSSGMGSCAYVIKSTHHNRVFCHVGTFQQELATVCQLWKVFEVYYILSWAKEEVAGVSRM